MINKSILKIIYFIAFILFFFPTFVIYIVPNTVGYISVCCVLCIAAYILGFYINTTRFKKIFLRIIRLKIFKYYLLFLFFAAFITVIHMLMGEYVAPTGYYAIRLLKFFIIKTILYLFPLFSVFWNIPLKKIIKLFFIMLFVIMFLAFVQFFVYKYNVAPLSYIYKFLTNARTALYNNVTEIIAKTRVHAFFGEPSSLGSFIFITLPLIFNFVLKDSKTKLINNHFLNNVIKSLFIPLVICVLFMTKSPIYILLGLIELFVLIIIESKYKRYSLPVLLMFICIIILNFGFMQAFLEDSIVYKRILVVIESLSSFEHLSMREASLASRIISYTQQLMVFKAHPIIGTGIANIGVAVNSIFWDTPLPFTNETLRNYYFYQDRISYNGSVVYSTLAQVGIIGFIIYVCFIIKNFKMLNLSKKYFQSTELIFVCGLKQSLISCCILSFYNIDINSTQLWFILGLCLLVAYSIRYEYKILFLKESSNE